MNKDTNNVSSHPTYAPMSASQEGASCRNLTAAFVSEPDDTKPKRRRRRSNRGSNGEVRKRKLTPEQVTFLELNFGNEHKLESERKDKLASELGLDPRQVAVWFQNRRARWKNKKLEEEYVKLKAAHDSAAVENCRLESEVLQLNERLREAEMEIQQLSERVEWASSNSSPSPSVLSLDAVGPLMVDEFRMDNYDDVFFMPDDVYGMEWVYE